MVAGTVVAVTVAADDAAEVPAAFVAVTVIEYSVAEFRFSTTIGEDEPVAVLVVRPSEVAVTVKEVAAGESAGRENDTEAAPLLNGLSVPTSAADTLVGASGSKKSFDACDFLPDLFPAAIYYMPSLSYAVRSPQTNQVFSALFNSVADDHCVRSLSPGVEFTVTPPAPAIVTCPVPV